MNFFIGGKLHAKARPRFTRNGHTYTDPITRAYEAKIATLYRAAGGDYLGDVPIRLYVEARFPVPKRTSKGNLWAMLHEKMFPTKRPDIDNISKIVMDALNGIAYDDDNQVVDLRARKVYSEKEGLWVLVDCYD